MLVVIYGILDIVMRIYSRHYLGKFGYYLLAIFLFGIITILPLNRAYALSNTAKLTCASPVLASAATTCTLNGTSTGFVTDITATIGFSSGLSTFSFTPASNWTNSGTGTSIILNGSAKIGSFLIGTISLTTGSTANKSDTVTVNPITFGSNSVASTSSTIRTKSVVNTLSALSVAGNTITPAFSSDVYSYSFTTALESVAVSATKSDTNSVLVGDGLKTLAYGPNVLDLSVTSESGLVKTYTINATRSDNRSTNNNLKSLSINHGSLTYQDGITYYNVTVDQSVTSVTVSAVLSDAKSSFVSDFALPQTVNDLKLGNNAITFKVKAENDSIKNYTINVNRNDGRSTNNYLNSLTITPGKIDFDKEASEYRVKVLFSVNSIEVNATAEDSKAKIESVGGNNLIVGDNTIIVSVTAENGAVRTYTITIEKLADGLKMPNDNYLSSLTIGKYTINLKKPVTSYKLLIDNESSLDTVPVASDPEATITISGNESIKSGSVIKIKVIAQDGTERDYTVTIQKKLNIAIFYALITVGVIALALSIVIFAKRKKAPRVIADPLVSDVAPEVVSEPVPVSTPDDVPEVNVINPDMPVETAAEVTNPEAPLSPIQPEIAQQSTPLEPAQLDATDQKIDN